MAYLGQGPFQEFTNPPTKDSFTGDGSTVAFDLDQEVPSGSQNALEVFVDNVRQEPGTGKAFTLGVDGSGDTKRITFSAAPANSASIYVINDKTNSTIVAPLQNDLNGTELILDADGDTSITADTDDRIDFKIANVEHFSFSNSSGDTVIKPMVDAKDILFQQYDGRTLLDINDGGYIAIANGATGPGQLRLYEDTDNGTNYSAFQVGTQSGDITYTLPTADGSSGTRLTTNGSGTLSWAATNVPTSANGQALGSASAEWSDLYLADGGIVYLGDDQDTTLTHVADTGILLNSTRQLQFGDSGTYIHQSADGVLDLVSDTEIEINATTIDINGAVQISGTTTIAGNLVFGSATVTEAQLEILDGATVTTTELNIMDGGTSASATTVADADRVVFNDGGTMKQVAVTDLAAYFDDEITSMPNLTTAAALVTVSALDTGSITSGFGNIDNGASNITSGGLVKLDVDADADDVTGDSATGRLTLGAGEDLNLYHGGTNSYIVNDTGDLILKTGASDEDMIFQGNDGGAAITALTLDMSAAGAAAFNSTVTATGFIIGSANINEAELEIIDGATITTTELNLIDGDTARGTTALADGDGILINDAGTMRMTNVTAVKTYMQGGISLAYDDFTVGDAAVTVTTSAGDITIDAQGDDTDIIFKGTDGGADTTFLTIDGSAAGLATFNAGVVATTGTFSGVVDADAGITVDNITIDGTEIDLSSGDLTIDVAGDIILDSDTGEMLFKDNTTEFARIELKSTEVYFEATVSDHDVKIRGNDGGSTINMLSFDTSAAGQAVFNSTVTAKTDTDTSNTGNVTLDFAANQNFVLTLTGNTTLVNPSTETVGQSGFIACIQDGTGSRTLSLGTDYETAGAAGITLSTAASATDLIPYVVVAANRILLGQPQKSFS